MAGTSIGVSIVIRETFLTADIERMLASDSVLYQTSPKLATVPIFVDSWVPPFVNTQSVLGLFRMFVRKELFLKTETAN